jgi:30S ribosomal protein S31
MGKGDRKTAKGKRYNSSYGNARTQVTKKAAGGFAAPVAKKATSRTSAGTTSGAGTATRAPAKKVVAKKTVARD